MRFAIAAGILAHTLPAASEMENSVLLSQAERRQQIQALLQEPTSGRGTIKKTYKKREEGSFFSSFGFQSKREGILKNKMKSVVECDPTASDADADLGVLSCGMGQYCMESKNTEHGGVCVDSSVEVDRELQMEDDDGYDGSISFAILCNSTYLEISGYTCDCDEFDITTGVGTIECDVGNYCFAEYGCNNTCATLGFGLEVYPDGNYTSTYCYNFFSPYEQQVCFTEDGDYTTESCNLSFDGVECASCIESYYISESNFTVLSNYNYTNITTTYISQSLYYCQEFDCTNTAGGHSGNTCEDGEYSIAPILGICQEPTLLPAPESPAPSPAPVPDVSSFADEPTPAPAEGSMAPSAEEDPEKTAAPTESGVPGLLSTKGAMSVFGLSMAMVAYFAG